MLRAAPADLGVGRRIAAFGLLHLRPLLVRFEHVSGKDFAVVMERELEAIGQQPLQHLVQNIVVADGLIGLAHNVPAIRIHPVRAAENLVRPHRVGADDAALQRHVTRVDHASAGIDAGTVACRRLARLHRRHIKLRRRRCLPPPRAPPHRRHAEYCCDSHPRHRPPRNHLHPLPRFQLIVRPSSATAAPPDRPPTLLPAPSPLSAAAPVAPPQP